LNQMGMNIPYPYDVPMVTGNGMIGFWTLIGFIEEKQERMATEGKGGRSITIDGGEPGD